MVQGQPKRADQLVEKPLLEASAGRHLAENAAVERAGTDSGSLHDHLSLNVEVLSPTGLSSSAAGQFLQHSRILLLQICLI